MGNTVDGKALVSLTLDVLETEYALKVAERERERGRERESERERERESEREREESIESYGRQSVQE